MVTNTSLVEHEYGKNLCVRTLENTWYIYYIVYEVILMLLWSPPLKLKP